MDAAAAFGNNDVAFLAWLYDQPIPDCLGFAVHRTDQATGSREPLPAWVGFEGESNADWKPSTTEQWPVQKFSWRDLTARAGRTYTYEIVPMVGQPGALDPVPTRSLETNSVKLTPQRSPHVRAYFNRGILSTQHLAHRLPEGPDGVPSGQALLDHIEQVGDPIRKSLAGQIIEGVSLLLERAAAHGGHCHCALYELNDPQLRTLLDDPQHVSLLLSNAGEDADPDATNAAARAQLHADGVDVIDRMLGKGHIGHNKFVVYSDPAGSPQAVLTGSTNWTYTGLCAQSNNALVVESGDLAQVYLGYWQRLKGQSPPGVPATQDDAFRHANDSAHSLAVDDADLTLWVSPNTKQHTKPAVDPPQPADMAQVFGLIAGAKHGILFLLFQPGSPSVLDAILDAQAADHNLFVRGAATDPKAIEDYEVTLYHRAGERAHVAAASALDDQFGVWQRELLKTPGAHAIVHDKIVVVDPLTDDCAVVTGSHNLGYRASYANDDNLLVVRGHRSLAEAYAVHVMDVYEHYRWRWYREKKGDQAFTGLKRDASWEQKYFDVPAVRAEVSFWL